MKNITQKYVAQIGERRNAQKVLSRKIETNKHGRPSLR
jgi:hypothetical protein